MCHYGAFKVLTRVKTLLKKYFHVTKTYLTAKYYICLHATFRILHERQELHWLSNKADETCHVLKNLMENLAFAKILNSRDVDVQGEQVHVVLG